MQKMHPWIVTFIFLQGPVSHSVSSDFSLAEDTDVKSRAGKFDFHSIRFNILDHSGLARYGVESGE